MSTTIDQRVLDVMARLYPMLYYAGCYTSQPGSKYLCTLERGHDGPHVAHGTFNEKKGMHNVMAFWHDTRTDEP